MVGQLVEETLSGFLCETFRPKTSKLLQFPNAKMQLFSTYCFAFPLILGKSQLGVVDRGISFLLLTLGVVPLCPRENLLTWR